MIKIDINIKGIFIKNKEFTLSQYAEDTQIFLDGSEMSLRKTLVKIKFILHNVGSKIKY